MMEVTPKPNDVFWTDDQWKAIAAKGNNILVSAAAGSGKTAVLVERIIRKIIDEKNPVDVDRLLVVTFTNAAASEMRTRIGEEIEKKLNEQPASLHLRRQLQLLNRANISTLHSFCMNIVRKYYYEIDVDPNFRILDDVEGVLIKEEILEEMFEEEYGKENNEAFYDVVDRFSSDRSDDPLRKFILEIFNFSRAHPDPNEWLDEMLHMYELKNVNSLSDLSWAKDIFKDIKQKLRSAFELLEKGMALTEVANGPYKYNENFEADMEYVKSLLAQQSLEGMYAAFRPDGFGKLKPISKKDQVDDDLKEKAQSYRDRAKDIVNGIKNEMFLKDPDNMLQDIRQMAPAIRTIVELVKTFAERFMEVKKEKAILDFNDLEHLALQVLGEKDSDGKWVPTRAANLYKEQFEEVLVDEYQDTNLVQETILSLISKENNRFMVGDVKQSIYRFRLAEPTLFLQKHKSYDKDGIGEGLRIDLSQNFRSRKEILHATNFIFRQLMDEEVGEIVYDKDAELHHGNKDYEDHEGLETEIAIINKGEPLSKLVELEDEQAELEEDLETSQLEARYMIKVIKKLIENKFPVYDKTLKTTRPVTYRDIVILMRSMPWAATIMDEFKKENIPIYAELSTGYFEAVEVRVMLSLLKVIDNPYQDIHVAAVLRSPIYRFDEQQLAHIRIMDKEKTYYEALKIAAHESPDDEIRGKAMLFLERLEKWRTKARSGSLSNLIWELYQETGYFDYVGGMPGGKQRQANLRALYDRARAYEETSFRGLFRFLRFVDRMEERGDDLGTARALGEQEDVVRIMTIHKSKGLEFPIVFVAGMNKKFHLKDLSKSYVLHKDLGFGAKYIDPKLRVEYPTLPQLAIKKKMHLEALAEEMRILYVALTRAKEKLFLVGTINEVDKTLQNWFEVARSSKDVISPIERANGKTYFDWIGPAIVRHEMVQEQLYIQGEYERDKEIIIDDPSIWTIKIVEQTELQLDDEDVKKERDETEIAIKHLRPIAKHSDKKDDVKHRLEWKYANESATVHRSKQTVSELKRELDDEYSEQMYAGRFQSEYANRPKFLQKKSLTAAEQGTVMHTVMQHLPLRENMTERAIERTIFQMVENELLTKEQAEAVNVEQIASFFQTDIGNRLQNAQWVKRELPFSLGIPASRIFQSWTDETDETILVQGVIDCIFIDETGKLVLLDYKTDKIYGRFPGGFAEAEPVLRNRYDIQISLYVEALETSWNEAVDEAHLIFFDGPHIITMKGE